MRRRLLYILFLILNLNLFAQNKDHINSLKTQLQDRIEDTTRIRLLRELSLEFKISDTVKAKKIIKEALELSKHIQYAKGIGMYYETLGELDYYHGEFDSAIEHFKFAREQYILANEELNLADVIVDQGNSYLYLSQFDIALENYTIALKIFQKLNDVKGTSRCLNNMGIIYKNHGEYQKALDSYQEVVKLYIEVDDLASLADTYINIGVVYVLTGEYHEALDNFTKALNSARITGNKKQETISLMNSGVIFTKMYDYQKALEYYNSALKVSESIEDKVEISKCFTNIGTNYLELGELDLAEYYIQKGLKIKLELGDTRSIANCYNFLAEIEYLKGKYDESVELDNKGLILKRKVNDPEGLARGFSSISRTFFAQGKTALAIQYADSSLKYGIPITALEHIVTAYDIKMQSMKKLKNYSKALEMAELFKLYSDSLMNEGKVAAVKGIEFKYQTKALEEENEHLKRQSETDAILIFRHRKIIIWSVVAIVMFAFVILLLIFIQRKQKHYNKSLEKKNNIISKQNRNLDTLNRTKDKMLSVISHDLRGTIGNQLTALSVLAREEFRDEEERKVVFTRLANSATLSLELLENLALWTRIQEDRLDFQPEKGSLETTVNEVYEIFKESLENKELTLILDVEGQFPCYYDIFMIKNVIKNLLSNAIKFTARGGEIKLMLSLNMDTIRVSISDNGMGISESGLSMLEQDIQLKMKRGTENEKGSGLGLQIVNTFLEHHKTKLIISSMLDKGTTVFFELPLYKR